MHPGLEAIGLRVPPRVLDLEILARRRGVEPGKYLRGLGQRCMAVPGPDEDVVTLAAAAGEDALACADREAVGLVAVGTESGVDQSKACAVYVHQLLGLPPSCMAFDIRQACFAATAGLAMALDHVRHNPGRKALVIGADIARYEAGSPAEPTQGAGAVALLVSARPRILELDSPWGCHTSDVMDFWRPNYRRTAVVDGKYSIKVYLDALGACWRRYREASGLSFGDHERFCYHLPFTRMAEKAHLYLARANGRDDGADVLAPALDDSLRYGRVVGNCYTASLYLALASLLETAEDNLAGRRVGFFSYGSGCVAAWFSGVVQEDYRRALRAAEHRALLSRREELSFEDYTALMSEELPSDGGDHETARWTEGPFRLAGISGHRRLYERTVPELDEARGVA